MPGIWEADTSTFPEALAPGAEWPTDPPGNMTDEDVANEDGMSAMIASTYWLCTWERAYLDAFEKQDIEGQHAALEQIDKFPELPAVQAHFPDAHLWLESVVGPVRAGEGPSTIEEDFHGLTCNSLSDFNGANQ
ncbi:hypothetical protein GCM10009851_14670 [Herbiconiux moechotypicola]|uniref:Uncharacterized protein n=2 Tax=Herbiconiux moechotypicola TaxID=637393 RepID=A0ABN3DGY1_9MICO